MAEKLLETEDTWSAKPLHRVRRFSDFIEQPVIDVIRGQIESGKVSRSYLITGQKGDGKSTLARLLAKKINNTKDDNHPNIYLFVATVKSGIDDVRALLESLRYQPLQKGKKVIIIEEAHGLTGKSGDALLVDLENPPDHVVFILCTNEEHKLKQTVRDRCRKIQLRPLSAEGVKELLTRAATKEKVFQPVEDYDDLFTMLGKVFEGRNRDAINTLSNLADISRVRKIKKEDIQSVARSVVGFDYSDGPKFLAAMYKGDLQNASAIIKRVTDYNGFTFALVDVNNYLLKQRVGLKPDFNYGGKTLTSALGGTKIPVSKVHHFQRILIDMRREVTAVSAVSPEAIFIYYAVKFGVADAEEE